MINVNDFKNLIREIVAEETKGLTRFKIGTIANANGKPTVKFAGESQPSQKRYSYLDSYTPTVNDRVLMAKVSGTYVILGKLRSD